MPKRRCICFAVTWKKLMAASGPREHPSLRLQWVWTVLFHPLIALAHLPVRCGGLTTPRHALHRPLEVPTRALLFDELTPRIAASIRMAGYCKQGLTCQNNTQCNATPLDETHSQVPTGKEGYFCSFQSGACKGPGAVRLHTITLPPSLSAHCLHFKASASRNQYSAPWITIRSASMLRRFAALSHRKQVCTCDNTTASNRCNAASQVSWTARVGWLQILMLQIRDATYGTWASARVVEQGTMTEYHELFVFWMFVRSRGTRGESQDPVTSKLDARMLFQHVQDRGSQRGRQEPGSRGSTGRGTEPPLDFQLSQSGDSTETLQYDGSHRKKNQKTAPSSSYFLKNQSVAVSVWIRVLRVDLLVELEHVVNAQDGDGGLRRELQAAQLIDRGLQHAGLDVVDGLAAHQI